VTVHDPEVALTSAPVGCPAHVPAEQFRHFDYIRDIEAARTPFDGYLAFRGEKPFWSDVDGGFWTLTSAAQVRECFLDPEAFSNRNVGLGYTAFPRTMNPDQLDPPEHTKYRKLLLPYFPPTAARALEHEIRAIARREIAAWKDTGSVEFVDQFAGRFPQIVFLQHMLHFPVEEMETFIGWEHDMVRHPRDPDDARRSMFALLDYMTRTVDERAAHPIEGDMISGLLQGTVEGRPVTKDEVIDMSFLLFLAAVGTRHLAELEPPRAGVHARRHDIASVVEFRVPFRVSRDAVDDVERGAKDSDWQPVKDAAKELAFAEDRGVVDGFTPGAITSFLVARCGPSSRDVEEPRPSTSGATTSWTLFTSDRSPIQGMSASLSPTSGFASIMKRSAPLEPSAPRDAVGSPGGMCGSRQAARGRPGRA
jgi:hypothetical protein